MMSLLLTSVRLLFFANELIARFSFLMNVTAAIYFSSSISVSVCEFPNPFLTRADD